MATGDRLSEKGRFAPLVESHPGVGEVCQQCGRTLKVGDRPALIEVGPATQTDQDKASRGVAYTASALMVHESCAYPEITTQQEGDT